MAAHTTLDTGASSAVDLPRSIQEKLQATARTIFLLLTLAII